MGKVVLNDLEFDVPSNWQDQGMVTLTIPSTDKNVRPNIIITKERLAQPTDLATYFGKIKEAVKARGIQTFQILDEREISIAGVPAMQMVCAWDLAAMKQMLGPNAEVLKNIKPGQKVQQIQVSFLKGDVAVNLTASFPAEQFEIYTRPFQKFLATIKSV
ncbi:MAG: DcrB-related protein [Deltaproteobacteria bacterium]|nr:DcrB-related protein [Deltaproteobacteria bacterium]MCC7344588.1 DcrB-related protein [Deltaproteobacteria bacterium]